MFGNISGGRREKFSRNLTIFATVIFFILTHSTTATITIKNTALARPSNHEKGLSTSPRFRYCHFVVYAVPLHYAQCVPSTACTDIPSTAPSGTPYRAFGLSSQNEKFKVQQLYIRVFTSWFIPIIYKVGSINYNSFLNYLCGLLSSLRYLYS